MLDVATRPSPPAVAAPAASRGYRPDIDGLRACAVLCVILTHAGVPGVSGGFLGVDVFFVISGYLIYRDLVARLAQGRFSLLGFYGRRMRRTLPALYLVCAVTLAGATALLMPADLDELARSLVAAVLLVPNIHFFTQTGYFNAAATGEPLLHTWSLGVEEQFYLVAPLLPLALCRLGPGRRKLAIVALFIACLALTIGMRLASPDAAFFLMPARAFEFLVGALLAERLCPEIRSRWAAETVTAIAAAALLVSITGFSDATPLPGLLSLVPCLATAAIIHVGGTHRTFVGAALGLRGPAFVGLISYSLYLWHWPLIVVARAADLPETPTLWLLAAALLLVVSVLSWRYVETPFRDPHSPWRNRAPVLVPGVAALLVAAGIGIVAQGGLPRRFPPDVASVSSYFAYRDQRPYREDRCFITSRSWFTGYDRDACLTIAPGKRNVLVLGDSHAAHLWTGLADAWPDVNFLQATASGCKPLIGATGAARCTTLMGEMIERFIPSHRLDAVVLGGLWENPDIAPLQATVAALRPHVGKVIVFGPVPRWDQPAATLIAKAMLHGTLADIPAHLYDGIAPLDAKMRAALSPAATQDSATYVSTWDAICPAGRCRLFAGAGVPMQFDYHHLTKEGADAMMATIRTERPGLF